VARVETNKTNTYNLLGENQREFVSYVLRNYVEVGVDELDVSKLSNVLTARYGSIHAAQQQLGTVQEIQKTFIDFQYHLYQDEAG
jgi:type I restriction enzyme R subunit